MTIELQPRAHAGGRRRRRRGRAARAGAESCGAGRPAAGRLDERTIRLLGRLDTPADFGRLVVTQRERPPRPARRRRDRAGRHRGAAHGARCTTAWKRSASTSSKSKGYSTTDVADRVRAEIDGNPQDACRRAWTLVIVRDAGTRVADSVADVESALIEGALLTVLVVFLFLNSWRSTVITGLALPVSVLASFVAVLAFGFTLNTMSLLGLSLAIGILIDDAIVVRENIVRHVEMGKDHYTAAHEGTDEIGLAVAATTFSIVVVFVPVAFMGGVARQWFTPFALTIACSVLVSLFVSFSLDPMLSAYWPDPHLRDRAAVVHLALADHFNDVVRPAGRPLQDA